MDNHRLFYSFNFLTKRLWSKISSPAKLLGLIFKADDIPIAVSS
jgi:hypothetical protein